MKAYCCVANDLINNLKDDLEYYEDLIKENPQELDEYDYKMYESIKKTLNFVQDVDDASYECATLDDFGELIHKIEDFGLATIIRYVHTEKQGSSLRIYIEDYQ